MTVRQVRVGDVLRLERSRITPDPARTYRQIGIYSWGKGVIENPPIPGAELSKVTYYRFPADALLLSNIQAWEAAIATSTSAQAEQFIASQRFLPYVPIRQDEVDTRYLLHFFLSDAGMALIRKASPGTVTRNRTLGMQAFGSLTIPLPDLAEQRGIAQRLDRMSGVVSSLSTSSSAAGVVALDRLEALAIERRMASRPRKLVELVDINPRQSRHAAMQVHFVPMADVDERAGKISGSQLVDSSELGPGYRRFAAGDIIFARITPCMQNGKAAIFTGELAPVGMGSTEFHVLRPRNPDDAEGLHVLLRTRWFRELAATRFTGTAGQQRVPASFLEEVAVPDVAGPPGVALVSELVWIDRYRRALIGLHRRRASLADALPKAARNEVFSKLA